MDFVHTFLLLLWNSKGASVEWLCDVVRRDVLVVDDERGSGLSRLRLETGSLPSQGLAQR